MAGQKNENWFRKFINDPAIAGEKIKSCSLRIFRYLSSAWVGWVVFGAALATISLAFIGPVKYPVWMLSVLGIQEKAGEAYPTISNVGNLQLAAEASNVFEKLGPVGDFFGGTVNPLLTFISIWLLIHSIKIQRDEMRAATKQARKSAKAAKAALRVAKIGERPFFNLIKGKGYLGGDVALLFNNKNHENGYFVSIKIRAINIGRSVGVIKKIIFDFKEFNGGFGEGLRLTFNGSFPIGSGLSDGIGLGEYFKDERVLDIFSKPITDNCYLIDLAVIYEDSFGIKYEFNVGLLFLKKVLDEPSVVLFESVEIGFRDLVDVRYPFGPQ